MKRLMKQMISIVICLSFASSPVMADATGRLSVADMVRTSVRDFRVEFEQAMRSPETLDVAVEKVVYDLVHIDDVVRDLLDMSDGAYNGLTPEVVIEVHRRFLTAAALMTTIMVDQTMTTEGKRDPLNKISAALGDLFFRILRQHQRDEVNTKVGKFDRRFMEKLMYEYWDDFTSAVRFRPSVRRRTVGADGNEVQAGPGPRVSLLMDGVRRSALTLEVIQDLQQAIHLAMKALPETDPVRKYFIPEYWGDKTLPLAKILRAQRLSVEKFAAYSYLGFMVWGLLAPAVDIVGHLDGGRSENSLFASSAIYTAFWFLAAATKASTISSSTLNEIKRLIEMTKNSSIEPSQGDYRTYWGRVLGAVADPARKCVQAFTKRRTSKGERPG